jgi:hypothetical protein
LQSDELFFFTDADALTEEQVRTITRFNRGQAVIHAIEVGPSHSTGTLTPLQLLARDNRGTYRSLKSTQPVAVRLCPPSNSKNEIGQTETK